MVFSFCSAAIAHRNQFCLCQQSNSSGSKLKFRQASNHFEKVLETAKLAYANKIEGAITSKKLGSRNFWRLVNSILSKLIYLLYLMNQGCFTVKNLSENSSLEDSRIFLPAFRSRITLKLHNVHVTLEVITNLDFSKASDHEYSIMDQTQCTDPPKPSQIACTVVTVHANSVAYAQKFVHGFDSFV